ncbi:DUF2802 domain-containing protein [Zoogloea dura]|jgi:hypothetical protein|uniref:DUF2802 domain-containing protein n=1 Tax=Zoogloea dura TaxID=2728840 RepID=A0A848G343_9RHOO|nr:DUF2802 domain-containing protein [Zoogloea dura]NML26627.1 DUF2802 domain-containing protein [Zoogloea dura]
MWVNEPQRNVREGVPVIELDVRDGIWALVAILAIYLAFTLFRLSRPRAAARADADATVAQTVLAAAPPAPAAVEEAPAEPEPESAPEDESVSRALLNELEIQQLRRDVSQLQTESDFLRRELAANRRDLDALRDAQQAVREQAPPVQYVRPVSPQHSEAMLLAGRGFDAAKIAEHCGISVAEAELVCALARAEERA